MSLAALGLAELCGLFLLSLGMGWRLLRVLRFPLAASAERALLAAALGLGALQFAPFACFALGVGTANVLRGVMALLALALGKDCRDALRAVFPACRRLLACAGWRRIFLLALAALLIALLTLALRPVTDGDSLDYHLTLPLRLLRAGRWVFVPTVPYTNWPAALEVLYTLPLSVNLASPIAIVPFLCGCLTLAALACYARRIAGGFTAAAAVCLLLLYDAQSSTGFWQQMGTGMVEVGTTLFTTLAIALLHRSSLEPDRAAQWRRLSAVFAGLAATTKLTGIWVIAALALVLVLTAEHSPSAGNEEISALRKRGRNAAFAGALRYIGLASLLVAPWLMKTWVVTGNPLYPMFYRVFGGIEWTETGWETFQRGHMMWNTPPNFLPTPKVLLLTHLAIGCAGLLLCLIALWRARNSVLRVPASAAAIFTACVCFANYFMPRFFMPVVPVALLCIAFMLRNRERTLALPLTAVFVVLTGSLLRHERPTIQKALEVESGQVSREAYTRGEVSDYPIAQYVNAHFPPDTTLLVGDYDHELALYRARALWPDCWLQDSIHYAPAARLEADMRRLNVTLLVLKTDFPDWCERSHYCRARMRTETPALAALARRRGRPLFAANDFTLYALDWTQPAQNIPPQ